MIHGLPQASFDLLLALQEAIRRYQPGAVPALVDDDVRDAAGALASTLETSAKGIIYEHQPASLPAQRLLAELRRTLEDLTRAAGQPGQAERAAASALRRIERAAREAQGPVDDTARAYIGLLDRLPADLAEPTTASSGPRHDPARDATGSRLIMP
jgi:hypothetical protein